MKWYWQIMKNTWAEYMMYRLNFVLWRVRMVIQVLITYFLWSALFVPGQTLFGYSQDAMVTYILLSLLLRTFVQGTTTFNIGAIINQGDLSNYLVRPLSFLGYFIAKDTADKLLNAAFASVELGILFVILRPTLFVQTNPLFLVGALVATILAICMFFLFSVMFGFIGFWSPDIWAPRFLSFVLMEFLGGSLFPLDILPPVLYKAAMLLPFPYFLYFPLKIYLGSISLPEMFMGLAVCTCWVVIFWVCVARLWTAGLRIYTAQGK